MTSGHFLPMSRMSLPHDWLLKPRPCDPEGGALGHRTFHTLAHAKHAVRFLLTSIGVLTPPLQATNDPTGPVNETEAVLRPFSLVIPFTVQTGDITGEPAFRWTLW